MNDVHCELSWTARDSAMRQQFEAWRRREEALERVMQMVPEAAIERFAAMPFDEVCRRAAAVEATLAAGVREHGGAATIAGSEEDDWLKLRSQMAFEGWATVGELPFGEGRGWALRLAAHEVSGRRPARAPGVVPSDGIECLSARVVLWNWCQRRLLRRSVEPLFEPRSTWRQQRARLRAYARRVAIDAPECVLARALTRLFSQHLPWYASVEVLALPDGHAVIGRWGCWAWESSSSRLSLLDRDGITAVALQVQNLAAGNSRRSWPLRSDQSDMSREHRADPDWSCGWPVPTSSVSEDEVRIWFGPDDAPAFE